jgi:hypothetical protein
LWGCFPSENTCLFQGCDQGRNSARLPWDSFPPFSVFAGVMSTGFVVE